VRSAISRQAKGIAVKRKSASKKGGGADEGELPQPRAGQARARAGGGIQTKKQNLSAIVGDDPDKQFEKLWVLNRTTANS
jgi:hypothetical protein